MKNQPKKNFQIRRMFGLAKPLAEMAGRETKDYLEEVIFCQIERNPSISELTFDEANQVIKSLGGEPVRAYGNSKRTENYRKQQAGIKTIETDAQLNLIHELAALRGWSTGSLINFCRRVIKKDVPTTTEEGNKIVEGLKAMNRRDVLLAFKSRATGGNPLGGNPRGSKGASSAAEPKFRRVA